MLLIDRPAGGWCFLVTFKQSFLYVSYTKSTKSIAQKVDIAHRLKYRSLTEQC